MIQAEVQEHGAQAPYTDTFGRVLSSARNHYFVSPETNN